jgi:hypothetical protein
MIGKKIGLSLILVLISMSILMIPTILSVMQKYDEKYLKIHNEVVLDFKSNMNSGALFQTENNKLQNLYDTTVKDGADDLKNVEKQINEAEETIDKCKALVDMDQTLVGNQLSRMIETEEYLGKIDKQKENKETVMNLHHTLMNLLNMYNQALNEYDEVLTLEKQIFSGLKEEKSMKEITPIIDKVNRLSSDLSATIQDLNVHIQTYNKIQI